jgi:putative ABC transport system permease protein
VDLRQAAGLLARETRWASRRLTRRPLAAAVAILTVAVALAPSLIFQLVARAVLPPLPFERAQDLVMIRQPYMGVRVGTSYPKLRFLAEQSRTMDMAFSTLGDLSLEGRSGRVTRVLTAAVTPNFFSVLGTRPLLGRTFRDDENRHIMGEAVVVLSERLWRSRFGGRMDVIGSDAVFSELRFVVIGVMPRDFRMAWWDWAGLTTEAWMPAVMAPLGKTAKDWYKTPLALETPYSIIWGGVGRIRPGHTLGEARAEVGIVGEGVQKQWPWSDLDAGRTVAFDLTPMSEDSVNPQILHAVSLLRVAGALVLILGGLNLASLFVTRGLERSKSLGLHTVLGAPRLALIWGSLAEALIVGILGGVVAVVLTRGALMLLGTAEPSILTSPFGMTFDPAGWRVDWHLVVASVAISSVLALTFSLVPSLRTTPTDVASFLRSGGGVVTGSLRRLRLTRPGGILVALEMALALALMAPALLLVRSLGGLVHADLGFRAQGVTAAPLHLPMPTDKEGTTAAFIEEALRELEQAPGVESASWASCLPIECAFYTSAVNRAGDPGRGLVASVHVVAADAFRTLGVPLHAGRDFDANDRASGPPVVILSERAAKALGGTTLGTRIDVAGAGVRDALVVGVVGDVPYGDLARELLPAVYFDLEQRPQTDGVLLVRASSAGAAKLAGPLRHAVESLDPHLEPLTVTALEDRVEESVARFRGAAWLLGIAAGLALLLSGVGVYGVVSSMVERSIPEIGLRMSLGASPSAIGRSVGGTALGLGLVGAAVGAALGMQGAAYLRGYLYGVGPWDSWTLCLSLVIATALAVIAAFWPARRASRLDPMVALRCE